MAACTSRAESSSCHRNHMAHRAEKIYFLVLYRDSLLIQPLIYTIARTFWKHRAPSLVFGFQAHAPYIASHLLLGILHCRNKMLGKKCSVPSLVCLAPCDHPCLPVILTLYLSASCSPDPLVLSAFQIHAYRTMLFHFPESGKFCFLCLGGYFSSSICPSSSSYLFFRTLCRPHFLQEAFSFSQFGCPVSWHF